MEQNSEDWLKFRGNSIGASEIPIIMGHSPYKKRTVLLKEKAFPFPKDEESQSDDKKFIFAKGHNYEKKIRSFVEFDLCVDLSNTPTVVFESDEYKTPIHASLDGITPDEKMLGEFKFVGFEAFVEYKKDKKPPYHYFLQIQQQLLITGAEKCVFGMCREVPLYDGNGKKKENKTGFDLEYAYFDVLPCRKTQEEILIEAAKFWDEVLEMRKSGPSKVDYSELDSLVSQYEQNQVTMDLLSVSQEMVKKKIFDFAKSDKIERDGYTVQTVVTKGRETVDYKKLCDDLELNIPDSYKKTGSPSSSQRITIKKDK